ncbi:MAG: hypothetical protein R3E48_21225 [Burkholderiaceae bacterium]
MAAAGGKEANYWPGFVDALSNVVVVMVFVLVVFTIALIHFSQNKAKEAMAMAAKELDEAPGASQAPLKPERQVDTDMAMKLDALAKENNRLQQEVKRAVAEPALAERLGALLRDNERLAAQLAARDASPQALERMKALAKENARLKAELDASGAERGGERRLAAQIDVLTKALAQAQQQAQAAQRQAQAARQDAARALQEKKREEQARLEAQARASKATAALQQRGGATSLAQAGAVAKSQVQAEEVARQAGKAKTPAEISGDQSALAISFPRGVVDLSKKTRELLDRAYAKLAADAASRGVELVSSPETGPYSEGRRLSYYRNLAIRNWLIEKGVPKARIRMRIAEKNTGSDRGVVNLSVAKQ